MQTLKVIGLGAFFSFVGFLIWLFISIMRGDLHAQPNRATALSAVIGGIIESFFSPLTWAVILVSFAMAFWLVRRTAQP